jgi:hypothetical protein
MPRDASDPSMMWKRWDPLDNITHATAASRVSLVERFHKTDPIKDEDAECCGGASLKDRFGWTTAINGIAARDRSCPLSGY